jgi:CMP/dCMP kinase
VIIAVDGPAGSGKSSVSREAARRMGIRYIDSGAVYRAITLHIIRKFGRAGENVDYPTELNDIAVTQRFNTDGSCSTALNGVDVSDQVRDEAIARNIGVVSDSPAVRAFVNTLLRQWAGEGSVIMDGRDIGSVVFPDADLKIYLDASVAVRSSRRAMEYRGMGKTVDVNEIKKQIILRDREDATRPSGRLLRTGDAHYIDTSTLNKEEVITAIVELVSRTRP